MNGVVGDEIFLFNECVFYSASYYNNFFKKWKYNENTNEITLEKKYRHLPNISSKTDCIIQLFISKSKIYLILNNHIFIYHHL